MVNSLVPPTPPATLRVDVALSILIECLQTGGFGIRKAPRQTLSLVFITLSLVLYGFDLGVNGTGPETRPDLTGLDSTPDRDRKPDLDPYIAET